MAVIATINPSISKTTQSYTDKRDIRDTTLLNWTDTGWTPSLKKYNAGQ